MRIDCPFCGSRMGEEYVYLGDAAMLERPEDGATVDYVFLRDNPTGRHSELWRHEGGCGSWLVVERNVTTHEIHSVRLADEARHAG